jgi:hypothetical protein
MSAYPWVFTRVHNRLWILGGMNSRASGNHRDLCLIDCQRYDCASRRKGKYLTGVVRNGSDDTTMFAFRVCRLPKVRYFNVVFHAINPELWLLRSRVDPKRSLVGQMSERILRRY